MLTADAASAAQLDRAGPIEAELRGVSLGTVLAFVLDNQGLALLPRLDKRGQPALTIGSQRQKGERWPVGWPTTEPRRDLVPALFDTVDVELDKVELPRVLAAVQEHVQVPILVDTAALADEKIDPALLKVTLPARAHDVRNRASQGAGAAEDFARGARGRGQKAVFVDLECAEGFARQVAGGGPMILPAAEVVPRSNRWA